MIKMQRKNIVQDSFIKYWDRQNDFNNESSVKTFLYVTVRNACLNVVRHEGVEKKYAEIQEHKHNEEEKVLEHIIRAEVLGEIHKAIEELPQGCRQVLKLAYFESMKNDEIAGQLGVSVNTVKTQKARALQLLRLKLDPASFLALLILLRF
ncbi:MAG: RNA polymerase sigma-70 factor [Chitinophagaceae bacterium]